MNRAEKAVDCFVGGFACSQAVLTAFSGDLGLDEAAALKIACGFGAGMGRTGQTCGAVTGAYLAIGLKHGRARLEDADARSKTYALVQAFDKEFKERHGSVNCTELLGFNLGVPEEYEKVSSQGLFRSLCPKLVRSAAEILEKIL